MSKAEQLLVDQAYDHRYEHFVEQAVTRDVLIARKER